jgi:hypothetical protein
MGIIRVVQELLASEETVPAAEGNA